MAAKSFSHFTYNDLRNIGLKVSTQKLFNGPIEPVYASEWLVKALQISNRFPHDTEKAKSELFVTPILMELAQINDFRFSVFSGYNLDIDSSKGLKGQCDYLLNKSPNIPYIDAPIFAIVEAKKGEFETGLPQLIAQLHASFLYNQSENQPLSAIFGAVTIGSTWNFVKYIEGQAVIDTDLFYINQMPELLGVLQSILNLYFD